MKSNKVVIQARSDLKNFKSDQSVQIIKSTHSSSNSFEIKQVMNEPG